MKKLLEYNQNESYKLILKISHDGRVSVKIQVRSVIYLIND